MRVLWLSILGFLNLAIQAQQDTLHIPEVVVSATRTEKRLHSIPMPVLLIKNTEIRMCGSSRLQDLLSEQPGLNITPQINGFGSGVQLQGLNPDYTLVMVDGEPMVGRLTGNLELSRFTLGNVKQVEIVKGPSSSLYGSEALGGVINVITHSAIRNHLWADLRYGTHQTLDASAQWQICKGKFSAMAFANHYRTNGFDLFPDTYGQTISPYHNSTIQFKPKFSFGKGHVLSLSTRWFGEDQQNRYQVVSGIDSFRVSGNTRVGDAALHPQLKLKIGDGLVAQVGYYWTYYHTETNLYQLTDQSIYYSDTFSQVFEKPEFMLFWDPNIYHKITLGGGLNFESVNTSRYGDSDNKNQNSRFAFVQHEWNPNDQWNIVTGIRYDRNSIYGYQWSPKLAAQFKILPRLSLKGSFGTGFKAPDFRYLYLNFKNAAAGYYVFGTEQLLAQLKWLELQGESLQYFKDPQLIHTLGAETSTALNIGGSYSFNSKWNFEFNFFRNDLKGLIESIPVANTKDLRTIYSYENLKEVYTQGIEWTLRFKTGSGWLCQWAGQWLMAKDKSIEQMIRNGQIFGRDPVTKVSYRIEENEYFGLHNRSRFSSGLRCFYQPENSFWDASLRLNYKSKFGIQNGAGSVQGINRPASDLNGNTILDRYDRFVSDYVLMHVSLGFHVGLHWYAQTGVDNLLDYKDPMNQPHISGRVMYLKLNFNLTKNN